MTASFFSKLKYEILIFSFLIAKIIFLPANVMTILPVLLAAAFCVFISWLLGKVIHASDESSKKTVLIIVAFFLGSSVSNSVLFLNSFEKQNLSYMNTFLVFCLLAAFASAGSRGNSWRIPVLCFVCTAAQPLFAFHYLPVIVILLLYLLYSNRTDGSKWLFAASIIAAAAALGIFGRDLAFVKDFSVASLIKTNWKEIVYSLAIVLPLILIFTFIWVNTIKNSEEREFKLIVVLIMIEPVFPVFALAMDTNHLDAVMAALFAQFCFFAYFLYLKNTAFLAALNRIIKIFEKNVLTVILVLIYLSAFSIAAYNQQLGSWFGN